MAILSIASWDRAFDAFHEVFFAEGTWRFPYSDSLIRLYPEQLFIDAALFVAVFVTLCALTVLRVVTLLDRAVQRQC